MSKIGNKIIEVPGTVQVELKDQLVVIRGAKGELTVTVPENISVSIDEGKVTVTRNGENRKIKAAHGLIRSLIANAVIGVDKPWTKDLEIVGTGYNVKAQGADIILKVGYSHLVTFKKIAGISFEVQSANKVSVVGIDKQLVGEIAYKIKSIRKPDPYKGKGIRFAGEVIRLKPGKKAKA